MRPIYNKSLFQVAGFVWMLARLTTAGYKGSLWCQAQNSHPRLAGWRFMERCYTYSITQLKPGHGSCCRARKKEEKASFAESDLYCSVEKRGVLDR